ncbi:MAG TPA: NADH-quinone oxidoreductase subunit L [Abditibacteriaceae bacterium]|jgi:NADH-quinone oxidoreductase subunit L
MLPLWLIIALPLLGFIITGLIGAKLPKPLPGVIASLAVGAAFIIALLHVLDGVPEKAESQLVYQWMAVGNFKVDVSLLLDRLSAVMILIITGIGFLIHVYSIGYMAHDHNDLEGTRYARFFSYLNLFIAFMTLLVLADNYLVMFVGWEGVGLCSYFLIGFWFEREDAAEASKKAFIVNRIGDFGFLLGMALIFLAAGSLNYKEVFTNLEALDAGTVGALGGLTLITLLLALGAAGKSAQIPLYTWLPDAMAGPTPVSALIHAATMVTAGVYMCARSWPLFEAAPQTKLIICGIGALTALFAGLTALAHTDIKKVLAYSTVSQLGFMFMAVGAGAYAIAIFHVFTHAFFKACLFLGAGSVIHALHGEQDMRKMGGLAKSMKTTNLTFMLSGLALAGAVPFAGFFSKDEIIGSVFAAGQGEHANSLYTIFSIVGLITALITAIYTGRQYAQVFLGESRFVPTPHTVDDHDHSHETGEGDEHGHHAENHHTSHEDAHESPAVMTLPLIILAIGAVFAGFLGFPHLSGVPESLHGFTNFLEPVFAREEVPGAHAEHSANLVLLLIGMVIGWGGWIYGRGLGLKQAKRAFLQENTHALSLDKLYERTVVKLGFALSIALRWIDENIVDGIVNGLGLLVSQSAASLRLTQTAYVRNYALVMAIGGAMILAYFWSS